MHLFGPAGQLQDGTRADPPEPVPATFDEMARRLLSWPTVPTLDVWAQTAGEGDVRPWNGRRLSYRLGALSRVVGNAGEQPHRIDWSAVTVAAAHSWDEIRQRQERLRRAK